MEDTERCLARAGARHDYQRCSELDPMEDTESPSAAGEVSAPQEGAANSIRWRILKVTIN